VRRRGAGRKQDVMDRETFVDRVLREVGARSLD